MNDIEETDIVFDCPVCGKSLAIDYRGAGLTIKCSDCQNDVQVPIPEGMEIDDLDRPSEDQEVKIIQLRRSFQNAQDRIAMLEGTIEDLMQRRDALERDRTEQRLKIGSILEKVGLIETLLKDVSGAVNAVSDICRAES